LEGGFTEAQLREFTEEGQVDKTEDATRRGPVMKLAMSPTASFTCVARHPMTRPAIPARPVASHVIDTQFEPSFRDLNSV